MTARRAGAADAPGGSRSVPVPPGPLPHPFVRSTGDDGKALRGPRFAHGVDHGSEPIILARNGDRQLWWKSGHTGWWQQGQSGYYGASLELVGGPRAGRSDWQDWIGTEIARGCRLSRARLDELAEKIDAYLDVPGITAYVDARKRWTIEVVKRKRAKR